MATPILFYVPTAMPAVTPQGQHTVLWTQLHTNVASLLNKGYPPAAKGPRGQVVPQSITVPIAKLTIGGMNGSLTFTNGILTSAVNPT
jgi:hypothetical protein